MKDNREADVMYLNSIAFFLAFKVDESPTLGSSQRSIAFYFKAFTDSFSLKDISYSII